MEKIRVSVYWEVGKDEAGNQLISYLRDDLAEIKLGVLDKEEDIAVEIVGISNDEITVKADGKKYPLKKGERVEFDCWTGYYGDSSDNQYFFIISWEDEAISNYTETMLDLKKDYIKN